MRKTGGGYECVSSGSALVSVPFISSPPIPPPRKEPSPPPIGIPVVDEAQAQQSQARGRSPDCDGSKEDQCTQRGGQLRVESGSDAGAEDGA